MKKYLLLLVGIAPFFAGYGLNALMLGPFYDTVLPYQWIGIACLLVWFLVGRYACLLTRSRKTALLLTNAAAFLVLLLLLYQELIAGQYWANGVGLATQLFYLPLLNLTFAVTSWLTAMWATYAAAFLMLCGVFYLGSLTNKRFAK